MMKVKYSCVYILLFGFTVIGVSQELDTIPKVKRDSIVLDTLLKKEIKRPEGNSEVKFEAIPLNLEKGQDQFNLNDYPDAAKYDSLWMKTLYDSASLFDTIYSEVANLDVTEEVDYEIDTEVLKERLNKLNQKTPFNIAYNPSLEKVIKSFLKRKRGFLERMLTKSQFYFPLFEQELDNHNIPLEIKYLAIVESALNPRAKSRVGATGLWQFMYGTGKEHDLDVSSYVDERSDPIESTRAACEYLSRLYRIFKDWDLALAAYNSGPGNVNKAIRRSGGYKNYWNIRRNLPRETAGYVPAFLATMYFFEYAEEHGLKGKKAERTLFETDTVHVKSLISFDQISKLVDVSVAELEVLNPSYKLNIIPFDKKKKYALRLPRKAMGKFVANEKAIYTYVTNEMENREKPLPKLIKAQDRIRYRVKSGDFLGKIAKRHGVRVSDLKRWNGLRSNNLRIGQRLTIYSKRSALFSSKAKKTKSKKKTIIIGDKKTHIVQSGDSLWTISKKYPGVSIENLREWNGISGNKLKPGTKLKLCNCPS
ncbi:MAG: LysM peptidoglycan-binding domain-containing protein [Cellulophaga sp.]